jgi:hypothetical protein
LAAGGKKDDRRSCNRKFDDAVLYNGFLVLRKISPLETNAIRSCFAGVAINFPFVVSLDTQKREREEQKKRK